MQFAVAVSVKQPAMDFIYTPPPNLFDLTGEVEQIYSCDSTKCSSAYEYKTSERIFMGGFIEHHCLLTSQTVTK